MKTLVLGAGIAGVTTAYYLAKLGHEVEVIERRDHAAEETSFANGGVMGFTQIEPWANPNIPRHLLKWIGRSDAPIAIGWGEIIRNWGWGLRFLRSCNSKAFRRTMEANARLTLSSREAHAEFRADTALAYDYRRPGALKIFGSEAVIEEARRRLELVDETGSLHRVLSARECVEIEPALEDGAAAGVIAGGIYFPKEEVGDCRACTRALADECERLGVRFSYGLTVKALATDGDRVLAVETNDGRCAADRYVVALASYAPTVMRTARVKVPIRPAKGVSMTVPATGPAGAIRGAIIDNSRLFGLIRIGDRLRLSGMAKFGGYDTSPEPVRAQALIAAAVDLLPQLRKTFQGAQMFSWAGLRALTPDGRPILGRTPYRNLFLNTGHGPQGWSTAFGCARAVACVVGDKDPEIDLSDFELARFSR